MAKLIGKPSAVSAARAPAAKTLEPPKPDPKYVPPAAILKKLLRRQKGIDGKETVTMSLPAFQKLMEAALSGLFDEKAYLEKHADIRTAMKVGTVPSAFRHFVTDGYFEGRAPLKYEIDEEWYVKTYPDVALAIKSGKVRDGAQHFEIFGFAEGRVPNRDYQKTIAEWRELEKKNAMTA